jgi:hypothetical protein
MELNRTLAALRKHSQTMDQSAADIHLYFEDSDICCRSPFFSCRSSRCVLMEFVPEEHRSQSVPCRHIPLNVKGDCLEILYRRGTAGQTKSAVTSWLLSMIETLQALTPDKRQTDRAA